MIQGVSSANSTIFFPAMEDIQAALKAAVEIDDDSSRSDSLRWILFATVFLLNRRGSCEWFSSIPIGSEGRRRRPAK